MSSARSHGLGVVGKPGTVRERRNDWGSFKEPVFGLFFCLVCKTGSFMFFFLVAYPALEAALGDLRRWSTSTMTHN